MNPPPPFAEPEPVADAMRAPRLRRFPVTDAPGFAIEVSDAPELVYLLGQPNGREIPVPVRLCGQWNPAILSGRHFFLALEPDAALTLTSVRTAPHHIGRLVFPSGLAASPWITATSRRGLMRRLQQFCDAFLGDRLDADQPELHRTHPLRVA
jgi:hypothetical protein